MSVVVYGRYSNKNMFDMRMVVMCQFRLPMLAPHERNLALMC